MMRGFGYSLVAVIGLWAGVVNASRVLPPLPHSHNCKTETLNLSTPHRYNNVGFKEAMGMYESDKKKVLDIAKQAGVEIFIASENYNLRARNSRGDSYRDEYTLSGTVTYRIKEMVDAKKFQQQLADAKIYVNANYNMRDNCKR